MRPQEMTESLGTSVCALVLGASWAAAWLAQLSLQAGEEGERTRPGLALLC
jgi:hypothetical protein